jgi:hypothetical protein
MAGICTMTPVLKRYLWGRGNQRGSTHHNIESLIRSYQSFDANDHIHVAMIIYGLLTK